MKTKAGFYDYSGNADDKTLSEILARLKASASAKKAPFSPQRLLLAMINEAALCIQEHIATPTDIDIAVLAGIGFPQSRGGILQYADEIGIDVILNQLNELCGVYGERFFPAPLIRRMVAAGFLGKKTKRGFLEHA